MIDDCIISRLRADLAEAIERRDTANRAISFLTQENARLAAELALARASHALTVIAAPLPASKAFPARALAAQGQQIGLRTPRG